MEKKTTGPILIGRKDAALLLGVSNRTMTNLIRAGELKPVCIGARRLLKHQDLLKFAESSHHKTTPTKRRSSKRI